MPKVLLFACDPGGANAIIPLINEFRKRGYQISLFGKNEALKKYHGLGLRGKNIMRFIPAVSIEAMGCFLKEINPDIIVTGTSANDKTEKYLWAAGRKLAIPSFAVLDQWINYGIRFSRYGVSDIAKYNKTPTLDYLPDKIFVMDGYAKKELEKTGVAGERVVIGGQPYFDSIQEHAKKITAAEVRDFKSRHHIKSSNFVITFASEPITRTYGNHNGRNYLGYTEKTIALELLQALQELARGSALNFTLVIKLHPKEMISDWHEIIKDNQTEDLKIILMKSGNVWELMKASNLVCGMTSMFLIEAVVLQRPVLSIQIGRKRKSEFVLEKRGILKPVFDQSILRRRLTQLIAHKRIPMRTFKTIPDPSLKIVNYIDIFYGKTCD
jgi:nucleotide-binding universal stress UspA family protein